MSRKSLFLYIILLLFFQDIKSQTNVVEYDVEQFVYWFHIRAGIKPQEVTSRPVYVVRLDNDKPKHGTVLDYEQDLWKQIKLGQNLLIGPFLDYYDALYAMQLYQSKNQRNNNLVNKDEIKNIPRKSEFFWYFLSFKITERKGSFSLKRIPAAVASGEIDQFKKVFKEGLTWKRLAIGPFPTQTEAEESKRLNRLEEDR